MFFCKLQTAIKESRDDGQITHGNDSDDLKKNIIGT